MKTSLGVVFLFAGLTSGAFADVRWSVGERREKDAVFYTATAHNDGATPARLGRYKLHEEEVALTPDAVALVMSGSQAPSPVKRIRGAPPLLSRTLVQLFDGHRAFEAAFTTFDRIGTEHEVRWDDAAGKVVVASYCDFQDYALAPGASVATEELCVRSGTDPYAALEAWAERVAAQYHPKLWPDIPAGWVGWSWVDGFNVERYEDVVARNARAIRDRLPGAKIDFIWVSLGNLEGRRPGNWLRWNYTLFPSGPEKLVSQLAALDYRLGLWCGAYWLNSNLVEDYNIPDDAVLKRNGQPITVASSQWGNSYILDPTHPTVQRYISHVFATWRAWGVRYYMIDFLNAIGDAVPGTYRPDGFHDRSLIKGPQTLRAGLKTIREAAGADTYLLSSSGATLQGVGLVDGARVGADYGEGRPLDGPGKGLYPATFLLNSRSQATSHRRATAAWAANYFTHRRLYLADSGNVLTVDKPVPLSEAEISASIFGLNGGPLMLGDDIERMDGTRLEMVKQLFPRLPESARPLDLFESPEPDHPKAFDLAVARDWDRWHVVAIFNHGDEPLRYPLDFGRLGADPKEKWVVWDHWQGRYLGAFSASYPATVAPRSVQLLRLSRQRAHPWLLSTDMHVRQGQAEISDCRWDAATKTLAIRATRPMGNQGNVYITVPKGMAVANPAGLWLAKDANEETLVIRCAFDFRTTDDVEHRITFK